MNTFKLRLLSVFVLACLLAVPPGSHAQAGGGGITYVDQGATGLNNGTSWANAYTDLQVALTSPIRTNIFWVAEGTYKPTSGTARTATFLLNDDVQLYGGFAGNEFDLVQRDLRAHVTILSGEIGRPDVSTDNSYHVVKADYTDNVRLDGFTIMDGSANVSNPDNAAGGVSFRSDAGDNLYLTQIIFKNNYAGYGGAIYNGYGDVTLEQVTFEGNTAGAQGGGVNNGHGTVTLTSVTFNGNSAQWGGGIYNFATVSIFNSTFYGNHATTGPGLTGRGGGIYNNGTVTVDFSTFSHNDASESGAGIFNAGSHLTLDNSILANSTSGEDCYNASTISTLYNLIEDNASAPHMCGAPLSTSDPRLGPLQNNGGFTQTMALLSGSPALDTAYDLGCLAFDQRGVERPLGPGCDLGAYEKQPDTWYIRGVGNYAYGVGTDIPVPADYNGDGMADIAVFRHSNSTWYIRGMGNFLFGDVGDIPVVADYNGDGNADIAVFRPTNSTWYVYGVGNYLFGDVGDIPVVGDYNGDGKADIAVFRPTDNTWYVYGVGNYLFGDVGDIPVVGDYNGDGKADIAVFRPSNNTWYVYGVGNYLFGDVGDIPVVGDYNGDKKADVAVFRP